MKNKRQREILQALKDLGGQASVHDIAAKAGMNVNGVSQTLGVMAGVRLVSYKAGESVYRVLDGGAG